MVPQFPCNPHPKEISEINIGIAGIKKISINT